MLRYFLLARLSLVSGFFVQYPWEQRQSSSNSVPQYFQTYPELYAGTLIPVIAWRARI